MLPPTCCICPELSRVFPSDTIEDGNVAEEFDFYINGDLCWGIGLLVMGDKITEHLDRFSEPSGKYFPLHVKDYAVVDFRRSPDGKPANISDMEKRITVFFRCGDFSRCSCKFGMNPITEILNLSA